MITPEEYLKTRVDAQLAWYSKNSRKNKTYNSVLKITEIALAASLPFLTTAIVEGNKSIGIVIGVIGMLIAIISGVISLMKYEEKWVQYRSTAEALKYEKYLYLTGSVNYSGPDAFKLFVEKVESIIVTQNLSWATTISQKSSSSQEETKG